MGAALAAVVVLGGAAYVAQTTGPHTRRAGTVASMYADRRTTPGALNPAVTQETIGSTICVSGWTATVRPPSSYTTSLKRSQLKALGYADQDLTHYEEDHFLNLGIGGDPRSTLNLWPEPIKSAHVKDAEEHELQVDVCRPAGDPRRITLAAAQAKMRTDWSR